MTLQTAVFAAIAVIFFAMKYFNCTDIPKIKGLPETPGVPIFGSLISWGSSHPRYAGRLAKKYGPVFQARFGNRVNFSLMITLHHLSDSPMLLTCAPTSWGVVF